MRDLITIYRYLEVVNIRVGAGLGNRVYKGMKKRNVIKVREIFGKIIR